ncbi:uncharacterized protein HD556DRAFT_1447028 [Suillus plorans]|uniref:Uncharacterized protein n=1 Tax=Suillus plorans TaxID=116603 RepID=A0A9P7DED3_9AGAM|nr:uncharacterized protein HD556DRAFT_1447028 [Suillus plorans]KAG1789413.1 hypothetical protein HD556DRAFT_1447028 [Suillus plorans]
MTQKMADPSGAAQNPYSSSPDYMDLSPVIHHPSSDYVHEQFGGGRRIPTPAAELTPMRLRTNIKATTRDVGIARQANICHQVHPIPSPQPVQSTDPLPYLASGDASSLTLHENSHHLSPAPPSLVDGQGGAASSNSSSLTLPADGSSNSSSLPLPLPNSRHTSPFSAGAASSHTTRHPSPFVGDPALQHPAQLNDLFFASMETQSGWPSQDTSNAFEFMVDNTYSSTLLSDQVPGMTAAGSHLMDGMSRHPPPLNLIPPTPLKANNNTALHGTQGSQAFTTASSQQLDLSYYPTNGTQGQFPEEDFDTIDHESGGLEQSLTGRRSSEANGKLEEGFTLLDHIFNDLTKSTMMPTNQVINTYLKSRGQEVHSVNYWNVYANYFKAYKERELARLNTGGPQNDKGKGKETQNVELHSTPGTAVRRLCYEKFKGAFPDDYQDILSAYNEANHIGSASTLNQRQQSFQKLYRRVATLLDSASTRFGFEAAIVLCGNVVNQDASLGHVHMTQAAAGFFETRCRANDDTIIGHLKAHVFNATSRSVVEDAFHEGEDDICDRDASPSLKDDVSDIQVIGDPLKWLKQELTRQVDNLNGKFASFKNFPWIMMPSALANKNLCIKGYPAHKCLLPGEYHNMNSKSKGIRGLTQKEVGIIVEALKAGMMFVEKIPKASRAALIASEIPVITGEAPPSDHPHAGAQQMFANRHTDYNGPSRVKTSAATTKVKRARNTRKTPSTSQQQESTGATGLLLPKPPPSCPFIVFPRPPHALPKLPPKPLPKPSSTEVIEFPTSESKDKSREMAPETEFEDASQGEKRKVADSRPYRESKRRASSAEVSVEPNTRKKRVKAKTKGRVKEKAKPLPAPEVPPLKGGPMSPLTISSSSDEPLVGAGTSRLQHAKRLRDGPIKPRPIVPGSRRILSHTHCMMYGDESKEGDDDVVKQVTKQAADGPVIPPPQPNVQQPIDKKDSSDGIAGQQTPVQSPIPQPGPSEEDSCQVLRPPSEPVGRPPESNNTPQHIPEPNEPPMRLSRDTSSDPPQPNEPPMCLSRDTSSDPPCLVPEPPVHLSRATIRNPPDHDQRVPHVPFTRNLPPAEPQHLESREPVVHATGWHEPPDRSYDTWETMRNNIHDGPAYRPRDPIQYNSRDHDGPYAREISPWNRDGVLPRDGFYGRGGHPHDNFHLAPAAPMHLNEERDHTRPGYPGRYSPVPDVYSYEVDTCQRHAHYHDNMGGGRGYQDRQGLWRRHQDSRGIDRDTPFSDPLRDTPAPHIYTHDDGHRDRNPMSREREPYLDSRPSANAQPGPSLSHEREPSLDYRPSPNAQTASSLSHEREPHLDPRPSPSARPN